MRIASVSLCTLAAVLAAVMSFSGVVARSAESSNSQLSQEIKLIQCTKTSIKAGPKEHIDSRCDSAIMPTVDKLVTDNPAPIITGTYDSLSTKELRVLVGGQWYSSAEWSLVIENGKWRLDTPQRFQLSPGIYDVIVEAITHEGLLLRDETVDELEVMPPKKDNALTRGECRFYLIIPLTKECLPPFIAGVVFGGLMTVVIVRARAVDAVRQKTLTRKHNDKIKKK